MQFNATTSGGAGTPELSWTASVGTISASGLYTAPATASTPITVTIRRPQRMGANRRQGQQM